MPCVSCRPGPILETRNVPTTGMRRDTDRTTPTNHLRTFLSSGSKRVPRGRRSQHGVGGEETHESGILPVPPEIQSQGSTRSTLPSRVSLFGATRTVGPGSTPVASGTHQKTQVNQRSPSWARTTRIPGPVEEPRSFVGSVGAPEDGPHTVGVPRGPGLARCFRRRSLDGGLFLA